MSRQLHSWIGWVTANEQFFKSCLTCHFYQKEKPWKSREAFTSLEDRSEYVVHIKSLKQALNHELLLKMVNSVISFHQDKWLKPYIDMNAELRQSAKSNFEKDYKNKNNAVRY